MNNGCPKPIVNAGAVTQKKPATCGQKYRVILVSKYLIKKYGYAVALTKTIARMYAKDRPTGSFTIKTKK